MTNTASRREVSAFKESASSTRSTSLSSRGACAQKQRFLRIGGPVGSPLRDRAGPLHTRNPQDHTQFVSLADFRFRWLWDAPWGPRMASGRSSLLVGAAQGGANAAARRVAVTLSVSVD